jgi:hypothetical protein
MTYGVTIPRHGSVSSTDADYDPLMVRLHNRYDVLLNGKPVSHVVAYHCRDGWVRRFVTNSKGKVRRLAGSPIVREETLVGQVSVRAR